VLRTGSAPRDTPLHVVEAGVARPGTPTFLLVHGFGATHATWRRWLPALERRGRVVLVDLTGFGDSRKPDDGRYGPLDQTELLVDLALSLGAERLVPIGHSYGGGLVLLSAATLAERAPGLVERIVVVAGAAYPQRLPPFVALARTPRLSTLALRLVGAERIIRAAFRSVVHDASCVDSTQVRAYAAPLATREGAHAMLAAARQIVPPDLTRVVAGYTRISAPTLLLWGAHDRVVPLATGARLEREMPGARLVVLEACGHVPQEERPEESLRIVEAFLDG
jgi:pimeloyl-ACP methyl ester carboxylesterase